MTNTVFQLVYRSLAVKPFSAAELATLLAQARAHNERSGITGLLLHHHGLFTQCLEGDEAPVRGLYTRIADDPRHKSVAIQLAVHTRERAFASWSMACTAINPDEALQIDRVEWTERLANEAQAARNSPGILLMEALWRVHQRKQEAGAKGDRIRAS